MPKPWACPVCERDAEKRLAILKTGGASDDVTDLQAANASPDCSQCRQWYTLRVARILGDSDRKVKELEQQSTAFTNRLAGEWSDKTAPAIPTAAAIITAGRLLADHPRLNPPVIDGIAREGETLNIISSSKVGKSWLGLNLLLSIVTGRPWLGRYATTPGRVLLVDNELHPCTIASRLKTVAEAMGIQPDEYADRLDVLSLRGRLKDIYDLGHDLTGSVKRGHYRFILIDAKYKMLPSRASENDPAAETIYYNLLDALAGHLGCTIGNIHHSSKGQQGEKKVTDTGSGHGVQSRAVDTHLTLREHEEENVVVLEAAVRSFAPVEPLPLRWGFPLWTPAEGVDAGKLKGRLTVGEQRQAGRDKDGITRILDSLAAGPHTKRKLCEKTGLSDDRAKRLLNILTAEGKVVSLPAKVNGNDATLFRLEGGCPIATGHPPGHPDRGEGGRPLKGDRPPPHPLAPDRGTPDKQPDTPKELTMANAWDDPSEAEQEVHL